MKSQRGRDKLYLSSFFIFTSPDDEENVTYQIVNEIGNSFIFIDFTYQRIAKTTVPIRTAANGATTLGTTTVSKVGDVS
jgi:hypothetical protein